MTESFSDAHSPRLRIAIDIRNKIQEGVYKPGDRLPTEHALTSEYAVSRPTIRAGLELLEKEGIIYKNASRARIVKEKPVQSGSASVSLFQRTIAVISANTANVTPDNQQAPGWESQIQKGITDTISNAGLNMLVLAPDNLDDRLVEEFASNQIHGMVFLQPPNRSGRDLELAKRLTDHHIPVVFYSDSDDYAGFDTVFSDHQDGACQLTSWLIKHGYRTILRIFPMAGSLEDIPHWMRKRTEGHAKAVTEAGLPNLPLFSFRSVMKEPQTQEDFDYSSHAFAGFLLQQFREHPEIDAIITPSDGVNYQTAAACRVLERTPGKEVIIVGYDNYWADCGERRFEPYVPPVTVDKQNSLIGETLVKTVCDRRNGSLDGPARHIYIKPQLIKIKT